MSIVLKPTPFIGQTRKSLPKCQSTNDEMLEWLACSELEEGAVVDADYQSKGRGQQGASWESAIGQNLTFTVLIRPVFLPPDRLHLLSMVAALAIKKTVDSCLPLSKTQVKWPNDVYTDDKKIAGTLIETSIRGDMVEYAIIGIGLNVNQLRFKTNHATSLRLMNGNVFFERERVLQSLFRSLEHFYSLLKGGADSEIEKLYKSHLLGLGVKKMFEAEHIFVGIIRDVNHAGQLVMEVEDQMRTFHHKEIQMLF